MHSIGNTFLTKYKVSTQEAVVRVLSLPMKQWDKDVLYVPSGLKTSRTRILMSLSILEDMHFDDENIVATYIIGNYEKRSNNLLSMCVGDFTPSYISKKQMMCQYILMKSKAALFQYLTSLIVTLIQI